MLEEWLVCVSATALEAGRGDWCTCPVVLDLESGGGRKGVGAQGHPWLQKV